MRRSTLTLAAVGVFALVLLSFLVRGLGQFVLGPRRVVVVVTPLSLLALALVLFVVGTWVLDRLGVVEIEEE